MRGERLNSGETTTIANGRIPAWVIERPEEFARQAAPSPSTSVFDCLCRIPLVAQSPSKTRREAGQSMFVLDLAGPAYRRGPRRRSLDNWILRLAEMLRCLDRRGAAYAPIDSR